MPQIILQYTDNIIQKKDFIHLFSKIHTALSGSAGINPENCKSRAIKLTDYFIGDGDKSNAFVHLELRIFQGRTEDIKQHIGNEVLKLLQKYFDDIPENLDIQYTIEIIEMNPELYFKS